MKIYLAGPMSGIPEYNFPEFNKYAAFIRLQGHDVVNPAEMDEADPEFHAYKKLENPSAADRDKFYFHRLRADIREISTCDAVAVLPGWESSYGASAVEVPLARSMKMPVLDALTLEAVHESVLAEAERLVGGDRRNSYGHPRRDFDRVAKIWSGILGCDVAAMQVALCMIGIKISRECNQPKRDNLVDIAGYARCAQMVQESYTDPEFRGR